MVGEAIVKAPSEIGGGTSGTGGGAGTGAGEVGGEATGGDAGAGAGGGEGGAAGANTGGTTTSGGTNTGGGGANAGGAAGGGTSGGTNTGGNVGQPPCPVQLVGFGAVGDGVTGGLNGSVVKVTTTAQFKTEAMKTEPVIIQIDSQLTLTEQIRPKADKTIVGVGKNAELTGGGLYILDTHNVIVQNLKISKAVGEDAITIQNSQRVWVDHCDLSSDLSQPKETYDDLVAVTHGSDNVTVSWTHFHDHYAVALIGHSNSADATTEDTNHLTVTFHHNWFSDTQANEPRVRFGTVHVFNNLFQRTAANAVISQMGAQVLVESNVFQSVLVPITTSYEDPLEGFVIERENTFSTDSGANQITQTGTWAPTYPYNADSAGNVEFLVSACAGVGKI